MFGRRGPAWVGAWVLGVLLLFCGQAMAQTGTGSITGTVLDESGAVIPGVNVSAVNERTGETRTAAANESGEFVLTALPPSVYTIRIEKAGFKSFRRTGITLSAGMRVPLGAIRLTVGEVTETLTVSSEGEIINTESADLGGKVTARQLDDLTIKGREPMGLLRTMPGTTTGTFTNGGELSDTDSGGGQSLGGVFGSLTPNINGARLWWNTVTVDGQVGSNPDWPGLFESAVSVESIS
jgi:Carboxypeptidase regulatory-like domain